MITLILGCIFGCLYLSIKNKIRSGYVYLFFLGCMLLPGALDTEHNYIHSVNPINIAALGICLVCGFIPWIYFDNWSSKLQFIIYPNSLTKLKVIFLVLIIGSVFSIIYLAPFAFVSVMLGAEAVRSFLYSGGSLLPSSPLTTIAVSFAGCHIFAILFFYISCITPALKAYRFWLVLSSLSYLVSCMAITARDGAIILPCFYLVFYLVFYNSFSTSLRKKIQKSLMFLIISAGSILLIFSISRFYQNGDIASLYSGTFGYVTQQPYVFDDIVEQQNDFWGFEVRFPLVNRILGIGEHEVNRLDNYFEWSFGTMYGDMFESFSWLGVVLFTLIYVGFYYLGIKYLSKKRNRAFSTLILFCVYLYIAVTGIFYMRAGGSTSLNAFFIIFSIIPFFIGKYLSVIKLEV